MSERIPGYTIVMLASGALLAGCASSKPAKSDGPRVIVTQPEAPYPDRGPGRGVGPGPDDEIVDYADDGAPRTVTEMDFLPFTNVGQLPFESQIDPSGPRLNGKYTRIRVMNDRKSLAYAATDDPDSQSGYGPQDDPRQARDYKDESRGWFARRFGSRKVTRAFLIDFTLNDPDMTASTALFSSSFESDSQRGESWSTDESLATFATPYFRVGPNTVVETTVKLRMAEEGDADVGANVVAALNTATALIAPTSALATAFTAPQITSASNFLDSSVSNLFGRSIEETTTSSLALKAWSPEPIFVVDLLLPPSNDIKDSSSILGAGRWAIYLDRPLISIFMGVHELSELNFAQTDPGRILSFTIGTDLTVHDYIFARLGIEADIDALNDAAEMQDAETARAQARKICLRVARGLSDVGGLNTVDIGIAWWATSQNEQFSEAASVVMLEPDLCLPAQVWASITQY